MKPAENINFTIAAVIVLLLIGMTWLLFKRRRRIALSISVLLITVLAASYFYYPTYKKHEHAERFREMTNYLTDRYPGESFSVSPETYEAGVIVGRFHIAHQDTPGMGVTMRVERDGEINQTGTWNESIHWEQEDLWNEIRFILGSGFSLDMQLPEVEKVDQFIDGELTVFAVNVNEAPAIAVFEYSQVGYALLALEEGQRDGFAEAEAEGHLFVYVDEDFKEDRIEILSRNGEMLDVSGQKGKLIIEE